MPITVSDPTLWSTRILFHLTTSFVYGVAFTNKNYEGEIQDAGSTVRLLQIGDVSIGDYAGILSDPENLTDSALDLIIDQKKAFNFKVDDVDARRSVLQLIDEGSKRAAYAISDVRDQHIASFHSSVATGNLVGTDTTPLVVGFGAGEIRPYDALLELTQKLDEANVQTVDRRIVVSPWFIRALKTELGSRSSGLGDKILMNGFAGNIDGVAVYQSNNVPNVSGAKYKVMAGVPMITFADAIVKTETYRVEKAFATGVKGLHVYGAKMTHPDAFALGTFNKGQMSK